MVHLVMWTSCEMCLDEAGYVTNYPQHSLHLKMTASMYPFMEPGHMAGLKLASDPTGHYSQQGYHLPHPPPHPHPAYSRDFLCGPPHHPMFPHPAADPFSGHTCHNACWWSIKLNLYFQMIYLRLFAVQLVTSLVPVWPNDFQNFNSFK